MLATRLFAIGTLCVAAGSASAETFNLMTPAVCPSSSNGLFTTGGQYLDANNGVLQNSWSMLTRWQGSNVLNPVSYDGALWTDYSTPAPHSTWQRGYQPENGPAATPMTQLHCAESGMILNSWYAPHQPVVGGGWNDMYGYAWGSAARPRAFQTLSKLGQFVPSELVVQGHVAVPGYDGFALHDGVWSQTADPNEAGSGQLDFFVYLQDTAHPNLHPIAVLAGVFSPGWQGCSSENGSGHVGYDYPGGVWYGASGYCTTDISTARYTVGLTTPSPFPNMTFYRIHYTPQNLTNLITRINSMQCQPGVANSCNCAQPGTSCPNIGYSTNPNDYVVQYAGVIAETSLCDATGCGTDLQDRNIGLAVSTRGVAVYHYTNP